MTVADTLYTDANRVLQAFLTKERAGGSSEECFLQLGEVRGSSTNSAFEEQIPVYYYTDANVSATLATSSASSLLFAVIPINQSAPVLQQAVTTGTPYAKATLTVCAARRGELVPTIRITCTNVRVALYFKTITPLTSFHHVAILALQCAGIQTGT
jgi:hypothetical protein